MPEVVSGVLAPAGLKSRALLLLDSLHGDGPTLDLVEAQGLRYVIGANKLSETRRILAEQPGEIDVGIYASGSIQITEAAGGFVEQPAQSRSITQPDERVLVDAGTVRGRLSRTAAADPFAVGKLETHGRITCCP